MHAMDFFNRRSYWCNATVTEPTFSEQRTTRGSLICLVNMAVGHLQFLRGAVIAGAYKKVLIEIFGQDSVRLTRDAATPFEVTTAERQYQR